MLKQFNKHLTRLMVQSIQLKSLCHFYDCIDLQSMVALRVKKQQCFIKRKHKTFLKKKITVNRTFCFLSLSDILLFCEMLRFSLWYGGPEGQNATFHNIAVHTIPISCCFLKYCCVLQNNIVKCCCILTFRTTIPEGNKGHGTAAPSHVAGTWYKMY